MRDTGDPDPTLSTSQPRDALAHDSHLHRWSHRDIVLGNEVTHLIGAQALRTRQLLDVDRPEHEFVAVLRATRAGIALVAEATDLRAARDLGWIRRIRDAGRQPSHGGRYVPDHPLHCAARYVRKHQRKTLRARWHTRPSELGRLIH